MQEKEKHIEEVMKSFNFTKVYKVMKFLDWQWCDEGVPVVYDLIKTAKRLLSNAYDSAVESGEVRSHSTGGFIATAFPTGTLELIFYVDHWDTSHLGENNAPTKNS